MTWGADKAGKNMYMCMSYYCALLKLHIIGMYKYCMHIHWSLLINKVYRQIA